MPRASTQPGLPDGFRRIAALLDGPGPRCLHYLAKADDRVIVRNSASVKIKHEEPNGGWKIGMFTAAIYRGNKVRQVHKALAGDYL
jgi:hypothetical protein